MYQRMEKVGDGGWSGAVAACCGGGRVCLQGPPSLAALAGSVSASVCLCVSCGFEDAGGAWWRSQGAESGEGMFQSLTVDTRPSRTIDAGRTRLRACECARAGARHGGYTLLTHSLVPFFLLFCLADQRQ